MSDGTTNQTPADPAPAPQGKSVDVDALIRENARLRDDMRKAAAERDSARDKARAEVDEQFKVIAGEYSTLKDMAIRDRQRAVDAVAIQSVPDALRPAAKLLLAGLRAEQPDLAIRIDADVDALAAKTIEQLQERLKDVAVPIQASHGSPTPAQPKIAPVDWRSIKDPKQLSEFLRNQ